VVCFSVVFMVFCRLHQISWWLGANVC